MRDVAAGLAKDYVALALAGIGISFPAHHFILPSGTWIMKPAPGNACPVYA